MGRTAEPVRQPAARGLASLERQLGDGATAGSSSSSAADGGSRGGILYETNLQYPWSGVRLRAMAEAQALAARAHLQEKGRLESSPLRRNSEVTTAALASTAASVGEAFNGLRVSYLGSLSDEPQMRAMASLFRSADPDLARFAVHPVTAQPRGEPDYLRFFLSSLPEGAAPGPPAMRSAAELARQLRADAPHIVLDGLWRKECDARAEADGEGSLPCVLLVGRAAPVVLSVLAAPVTSGARGFVDYTLGDPVCLPPRLARPDALAFTERFALLPCTAPIRSPTPCGPTGHGRRNSAEPPQRRWRRRRRRGRRDAPRCSYARSATATFASR